MPQPNEFMLKKEEAEDKYQRKLTAGTNITIDPVTNTISAAGGGSTVTYAAEYSVGDLLGTLNINGTANHINMPSILPGSNISITRDAQTGAIIIASTGSGGGTITDVRQENVSVVDNGVAYVDKNHIWLDEDGVDPDSSLGADFDLYISKVKRIDPEVDFVEALVWQNDGVTKDEDEPIYEMEMSGTGNSNPERATYAIHNLEVGATYGLTFNQQISSSATFYNSHPYGTCISETTDGAGQSKPGYPGTYDEELRFFSYNRDTDEHNWYCEFEATQETMYLVTFFGDVYDGTNNTFIFSDLTVKKIEEKITDLWFKVPSPTGWIKFAGGGASNTSVRVLNSKAEWDALPNSKYTDNVIYVIKGEGGRQSVIANPTGPATDTLVTIGIDGIVYDIAGSGGGGAQIDVLFNKTPDNTHEPTITLSNSLFDYDEIAIDYAYVNNNTVYHIGHSYATDDLNIGDNIGFESGNGNTWYNITNNTTLTLAQYQTAWCVVSIIGFKYGNSSGGGGSSYGTGNPVSSGKDGDIYYLLNGQGKKRALFLYKQDHWDCIEGTPKGLGFTKVYSDAYNTDGNASATITIDNSTIQSGATAANFFKDLKSVYYSNSSTNYQSNTIFNTFTEPDQLSYSWTTQSGSCHQWFNVYYIPSIEDVNILSDWKLYTQTDTYTFSIPAAAQSLTADDFIIDFQNVLTGNGSNMDKTDIVKTIVNDELQVYLPVGGRGYYVRILYSI